MTASGSRSECTQSKSLKALRITSIRSRRRLPVSIADQSAYVNYGNPGNVRVFICKKKKKLILGSGYNIRDTRETWESQRGRVFAVG